MPTTRSASARRAAFALTATLLGLGLLEGAARLVETLAPPLTAYTALPGPGGEACLPDCVPGAATAPSAPFEQGIRLVYDPVRGVRMALPDDPSVHVNRLGLRGPELPEAKPEGELRLLTLGDSTIWGHAVPDGAVFSELAAAQLSAERGRPVRAVNGAQPGHTSADSLRSLEVLGAQIAPDIVLIANLWSDLFHEASPVFAEPPGQSAPSALYRLAHRALGPLIEPRLVSWIDPERGVGLPAPGLEPHTALPTYLRNLSELGARSRALGAEPVFLLLPAPIDLDPAGPPEFIRRYRHAMRATAERLDAPLIDAAQGFLDAGATNALFYDQVHPSLAGHALLGELVAEGLGPLAD
ncbi:MAG: SGNH/GDSL hydrolase family protein [Alphaproteobacteria bacterium]|nr:SGNH/GDSL hydrolase family protein [Alphaproteobacteria bacterium]